MITGKVNEFQLYILVGKKIKEIREKRGMTQQELSDLCNFEKSNVSRIEAGRTNLTLKSLFFISRALDVQLKDLFEDISNHK